MNISDVPKIANDGGFGDEYSVSMLVAALNSSVIDEVSILSVMRVANAILELWPGVGVVHRSIQPQAIAEALHYQAHGGGPRKYAEAIFERDGVKSSGAYFRAIDVARRVDEILERENMPNAQ